MLLRWPVLVSSNGSTTCIECDSTVALKTSGLGVVLSRLDIIVVNLLSLCLASKVLFGDSNVLGETVSAAKRVVVAGGGGTVTDERPNRSSSVLMLIGNALPLTSVQGTCDPLPSGSDAVGPPSGRSDSLNSWFHAKIHLFELGLTVGRKCKESSCRL